MVRAWHSGVRGAIRSSIAAGTAAPTTHAAVLNVIPSPSPPNRLLKNPFIPSPSGRGVGVRANSINELFNPLTLALSPFQGERGFFQ
jgi:hypothetical protein